MQAPLLTKKEMLRQISIQQVIVAYNQELLWKKKVAGKLPSFQILRDPSEDHIAKRKLEEFHDWCPVSDSPPMCPG